MDRKEAIDILNDERIVIWTEPDEEEIARKQNEAIDMAIEALSAEPTDLISKSAVMETIGYWTTTEEWGRGIIPSKLVDMINELPSASIPTKCIARISIDVDEVVKRIKDEYEIVDRPSGEWIPCSERLPETDNKNEINEYDVLLLVKDKKHTERSSQVYIGKLNYVDGDDGSGNIWGIKTKPCDWTIWGWSYFNEPDVIAWMPLPKPYCPNCGAKMGGDAK